MELLLNNVTLHLDEEESVLDKKIISSLKIKKEELLSFDIVKKATDARKKNNILFIYSLHIVLKNDHDFSFNPNVRPVDYMEELSIPQLKSKKRPVIIGFGPSGMLSGLYLARAGMKPIIFERGKCVEEREEDVRLFKEKGIFSSLSNVCFGEGGAGTFSDGKLNTNVKDPRIRFILKEFIHHGAPKEIYYEAHPHIGSDYLRSLVKNIRNEIISLGGEIHFQSTFVDFTSKDNVLKSILVKDKNNHLLSYDTDDLILAIGHSARDTFTMLNQHHLLMKPKDFSVGVRIEMKQSDLNQDQYGSEYKNPKLKPAEYKIVEHLPSGRAVYSFCMCPGGEVVASNTEENSILVNGMSYFKRDLENANSALLVSVKVADYYHSSPLDGMYYQEEMEKKAFNKEYPYYAPVQLVGDFLKDRKTTALGKVVPSYKPGCYFARMDDILPSYICSSLREGLVKLQNKLHTLKNMDNVLTGVETRSSSPIAIPRDERGYASIDGIYPCGEGASYAGGIMSAAIDGLRIAECIKNKYQDKD